MRIFSLLLCLALASPSQAQSLALSAGPGGASLVGTVSPGYPPPGYSPPGYYPPGYQPFPGQPPLGAPQPGQDVAMAPAAPAEPSLLDKALASPAPTAAEQGASFEDPAEQERLFADEMARHTARQEGAIDAPPAPATPVGGERALAPWVQAWTGLLLNAGVSDAKIHFEAGRLDAVEFAHWASRQMAATPTASVVGGRGR